MLSVIMPAKDLNESCLPSINSILTQDVELELIIVVDGGANTLKIEDPRVKVIPLATNGGHNKAINIGYSYTKFDLITVHDSDDISEKNRFKILLSEIDKNQAISSYLLVQRNNKETIKEFNSTNFIKQADYYKNMVIKAPANHCATIMTRKLWDILGPYNTKRDVRADSERMIKMGIYLLLNKTPFKVIKEPLYRYCVNPQSVSQQNLTKFDMQKKQRRMIIKRNWSEIQHMNADEFLKWWNLRMDFV